MRRLISSFLLICILSVVIPFNSNAMEVQRVSLSDSEKGILDSADRGEVDNMTGEGAVGDVISTTVIVIGIACFVLVVGTAIILLAR